MQNTRRTDKWLAFKFHFLTFSRFGVLSQLLWGTMGDCREIRNLHNPPNYQIIKDKCHPCLGIKYILNEWVYIGAGEPIVHYKNATNMMTSSNGNIFRVTGPLCWELLGFHRSPVNFPHKGQWRGALMFSLICAWINGLVCNLGTGDLRRHSAHYDVTVMNILSAFNTFMLNLAKTVNMNWI